eukprot:6647743-Alexandrium_andersonii.AAC.1
MSARRRHAHRRTTRRGGDATMQLTRRGYATRGAQMDGGAAKDPDGVGESVRSNSSLCHSSSFSPRGANA